MMFDHSFYVKVLLDVCNVEYTEKQLIQLTSLLSKLYIVRDCFVNLEEISPETLILGSNERKESLLSTGKQSLVEEISSDSEEIHSNAEEFHLESGRNFLDSDQSYETSEDELENIGGIAQKSGDIPKNGPIVISLRPKRKHSEGSESEKENSPKKPKVLFLSQHESELTKSKSIRKICEEESEEPEIIGVSFSNKKIPKDSSNTEEISGPVMCEFCDKYFVNNQDLKIHMIIHEAEKIEEEDTEVICDKCCKVFDSMKDLNVHTKEVHENEKMVKVVATEQQKETPLKRQALLCDKCYECFESKETLDLHEQVFHQRHKLNSTSSEKDQEDDQNNLSITNKTPKQRMNFTITPRGATSFVMKVTKQSDGSITCRLCYKNFKNIQEVTKHAPDCTNSKLFLPISKKVEDFEEKPAVMSMKQDDYHKSYGDQRYEKFYGLFLSFDKTELKPSA